jgi:hypothetical protein
MSKIIEGFVAILAIGIFLPLEDLFSSPSLFEKVRQLD